MNDERRPVRIYYRGIATPRVGMSPPMPWPDPVIYDHEGFPVRWAVPAPEPRQIGFQMRKVAE